MTVKGRSLAKDKQAILQVIFSVKINHSFKKKPPETCFYTIEIL